MILRWTAPAAEDLYNITRYIQRDKPEAARRVAKVIYDACTSLIVSPLRGRLGRLADTRELVLHRLPYIIIYRVSNDFIEILHIWHGAQNR